MMGTVRPQHNMSDHAEFNRISDCGVVNKLRHRHACLLAKKRSLFLVTDEEVLRDCFGFPPSGESAVLPTTCNSLGLEGIQYSLS
jgi:hypothetical protein